MKSSDIVTWKELEKQLGSRYKDFLKWMAGQTATPKGVFKWDLERYLERKPIID